MSVSLPDFFTTVMPALSEKGRAFLLQAVQEQHYPAGELIFTKGDEVSGLYVLLTGRVGIQKKTGFEDKTQIIALLDPGAPLGERGILSNMVHGAGSLAVEDSVLGFLSRADYLSFCEAEPSDGKILLEWLLIQVSRRLEKASERLAHVL